MTSLIARTPEGRQIALGALAYLLAVLVAVSAGVLYLHPPQQQSVTFEITDAAAVRAGQDVRVAGVPVGKVESVSLRPDRVRVTARIRRDVFLGTDTTVDIRMLTAVGGYYVALHAAGTESLGNGVISADRVTPPYRLPDLLHDAPPKIRELNAPDIGASLDRVAAGLQANPGSVRSIIDGIQALAEILSRQRDQLETTVSVSREYLSAFDTDRAALFDMLRKTAIILQVLRDTRAGFTAAYQGLAQLFGKVDVLSRFYAGHRAEVLAAVTGLDTALRAMGTDMPTLIGDLEQFVDQLNSLLGPDGVRLVGAGQVLATDLCVPIPGRSC
ncbi:MCE family protein [Nocardia brasiliensis]|uniref:MCE family protein n=1 Tax=Nocardia brasiliensis TaxID=37326 RepID=A0A6G9XTF2_NOCBR|nr:MlaD family protein [Nocardia brasiliensis]QIS04232.1 MCE family protein [Nocardia brasiliensis]